VSGLRRLLFGTERHYVEGCDLAESRALASFRKFLRALSIAECSASSGFRMLSSIWLRMAPRAKAIRCATLLESVSRIAASYRDFQSELASLAGIGRQDCEKKRSIVAHQMQFLQSCRIAVNTLPTGSVIGELSRLMFLQSHSEPGALGVKDRF
jgi:hypothetical protein